MQINKKLSKKYFFWLSFTFANALLVLGSLFLGSYQVNFDKIVHLFLGHSVDELTATIIWQIRLPRVLTAISAGSGLAVVGLLLQTLFRNPLADASVLGITQGSAFGVAAVLLGFYDKSFVVSETTFYGGFLVLPAMVGASTMTFLLLLLASRLHNPVYLLITGLMAGSFSTAVIALWQYSSKPEQLQSYLIWSLGSTGGTTLTSAFILAGIVIISIAVIGRYHRALDKLSLGDSYAQHLGVNLKKLRIIIITVSGLLVGSVTAFCGPIAFVGLAVPFVVRLLTKTHLFLASLIGAILVGSFVVLATDNLLKIIAQNGYFYPLNALLTILGAPIVISILYNQR